jgi:hypothetical protein
MAAHEATGISKSAAKALAARFGVSVNLFL